MKANTIIMFDEFLKSINFSLNKSLMKLNLDSIEKIKKCKSPDILLRSYKEIHDACYYDSSDDMANLVLERLVSDKNYLNVRLIKLLKKYKAQTPKEFDDLISIEKVAYSNLSLEEASNLYCECSNLPDILDVSKVIAASSNYELRNLLIRLYKNKGFKLNELKEIQNILSSVYDDKKFIYFDKFFNFEINHDDKIEIAKLIANASIQTIDFIFYNIEINKTNVNTIKLLLKCDNKETAKNVFYFIKKDIDHDFIKLLVDSSEDKSKITSLMLKDDRYAAILYGSLDNEKSKHLTILKQILNYIKDAETKECALAMKEVADNHSLGNALSIIEYQAKVKNKDFAIVIGNLSNSLDIISLNELIDTYDESKDFINPNNLVAITEMKDMIKKTPNSCETILKILSYENDFEPFDSLYKNDRVAAIDGLKELNRILYSDSYEVDEKTCYVPYIKKEGK